jgi:hypothetical protein
MNRNYSIVRPLADINTLGKRTSSVVSRSDYNPEPTKTPFFKNLQLSGSFNIEKEAPNTGNFNQIDYSK